MTLNVLKALFLTKKNKKCDWPSSELTCDTETSTSSAGTTQTSTTRSSTRGSTSESESTSSGECTEEGFFRNPDDCSKYYRCLDEGDGTLTREDFSCEENEVFDEEMRYCNRKDLAPPCEDGSSSTTSGEYQSTDSSSGTTSGSSPGTTSDSSSGTTSDSSSGTTSESAGSGECKKEGFHRDPNDCSKFYRCVDFKGDGQSFTRYDFDCPEGLVFDEDNEVCNWPSSVPSCESSGGGDRSTSGSSSTDSGTTSTQGERTGSTTQSAGSSSTSSDQGSASTTGTESSPTSSGSTTSSGGRSTTKSSDDNRSSGDIECTQEGFFRHPDDCTKFYRCVDFAGTGESYVRYDFECPDDLVFDEVNSVCNWPEQSPPCDSGSRRGDGDSQSTTSGDRSSQSTSSDSTGDQSTRTTQGTTTSGRGDQTTRGTSTTAGSSSDEFQCTEEGFFRHPTDCKKYYECKRDEETGELVKIDCECPDGQVFDSEGWYCNAEELSPPCDESAFRCRDEGFFRDPEDCTRYYQCNRTGPGENDFSRERFQCPDGHVFDENGRYCNAAELSEPCDQSSTSSSSGSSGTPSGGSTTSSSSSTTSSSSETSSEQAGECRQEGFFRNPEDCTKYYHCTRNEETGGFDRTDHTCPDGRVFDEGPSYCNDPQLSEEPCETGSSATSQQTRGTEPSTTTQQSRSTESESTTRQQTTSSSASTSSENSGTTSSAGTRRGGGGDPDCTQEGFFRHPDDCNKFYRCVDFSGSGESYVRYDFDCPEGLHFDEVNSVCNWPTMTPRCESDSGRIN